MPTTCHPEKMFPSGTSPSSMLSSPLPHPLVTWRHTQVRRTLFPGQTWLAYPPRVTFPLVLKWIPSDRVLQSHSEAAGWSSVFILFNLYCIQMLISTFSRKL
jgi:hypothetical protein